MVRSSQTPRTSARSRHALRPRLDPLEGRLLLTAGDLDPTFGTGGLVTATHPGADEGRALVLQPDGKIVMAGYVGVSGTDSAVARFNSDGSFDGSFRIGGFSINAFSANNDEAVALTLQSDGKIVTAGYVSNGTQASFAVARFLNDTASASASVVISSALNGSATLSASRSLNNAVAPGTAAFDRVLGMVALGLISGPSEPVVVLGDMGLPLARSRVRWSSQSYRFGQP